MFDKNKAQVEILKAILDKNKYVRKFTFDDMMAITLDGYCAYIFDDKSLIIDVSGIAETKTIKFNTSKQIKVFDTMIRKIENGKTIVKLTSEDGSVSVYAQSSLISKFSGCTYYATQKRDPIICADGFGNTVGILMPIACKDF